METIFAMWKKKILLHFTCDVPISYLPVFNKPIKYIVIIQVTFYMDWIE